ncbi:hypothetical protein ACHAXT_006654 [Thalassiosira profunda]
MGLIRSLLVLAPAALSSVDAFSPASPAALSTSRFATSIDAAAEIQFVKGLEEKVVPDIKLTRATDGSSGTATFKFSDPNVFDASTASQGDITGMFLVDEEGEMSTTDVNASFVNGKPQSIESVLVMKSPAEWDRFMRFSEYGWSVMGRPTVWDSPKLKKRKDEGKIDVADDGNVGIGGRGGLPRASGGLFGSGWYHSPAFTSLGGSVAMCAVPLPPPTVTVQQPSASTPAYKPKDPAEPVADPVEITGSDGKKVQTQGGMWGEEDDGLYHGLFPRRQLWRPRLEYPLWDNDWDGRRPPPTPPVEEGEEKEGAKQMTEAQRDRYIRKNGVTRHVIMIRHGQYDESSKEDAKRLLTPLGRKQAELTGKRLGKLIRGVNEEFGPCRVKVVRVSDLARAKETADLIYDNMDLGDFDGEMVEKAEPDPDLNEGRPCHHIPGGKARPSVVERTDEHHPRIERAFRRYFFRADAPPMLPEETPATSSDEPKEENQVEDATEQKLKPHPQHEFEIIVCHANVIRYCFCRALQLPPEAWLRLCTFNCSLTYFTIRPTGTVSCRMLGDIGHLPYDMHTFSMHPGYNW